MMTPTVTEKIIQELHSGHRAVLKNRPEDITEIMLRGVAARNLVLDQLEWVRGKYFELYPTAQAEVSQKVSATVESQPHYDVLPTQGGAAAVWQPEPQTEAVAEPTPPETAPEADATALQADPPNGILDYIHTLFEEGDWIDLKFIEAVKVQKGEKKKARTQDFFGTVETILDPATDILAHIIRES